MPNFELLTFSTEQELARSAAAQWLAEVPAGPAGLAYGVALSGGRIARQFCSSVTGLVKDGRAPLASVDFFWGDERCVPPEDPESNFRLARELLLEPLGIPSARIHRIRGEAESAAAAAEAAADLRRFAPRGPGTQPVLDLIFLGMGENGHVASLFPEENEPTRADPAVYRAVTATKPPPRRITLGYAAIGAARQVWVLVSGTGKEDALRESLSPTGTTPLARVLRLRSLTRIFTDLRFSFKPPPT